jgi:hypothetical protein
LESEIGNFGMSGMERNGRRKSKRSIWRGSESFRVRGREIGGGRRRRRAKGRGEKWDSEAGRKE